MSTSKKATSFCTCTQMNKKPTIEHNISQIWGTLQVYLRLEFTFDICLLCSHFEFSLALLGGSLMSRIIIAIIRS